MKTYYGTPYPIIGDYVVGIVDEIHEGSGYFVLLPEYNNIKGFVGIKDISRNRFRRLKGIITKGKFEILEVINLDNNGNVDLSRKFLCENLVTNALQKYKTYKKIYDWMQHTSQFDESTKLQYIQDVLYTNEMNDIPDKLFDIHNCIKLLTENQEKELILSGNITLDSLKAYKVDDINLYLQYLREKYDVFITTKNTKKSVYTIINRFPCLQAQFDMLLENIKNDDLSEIVLPVQQNIKQSSLGHNLQQQNEQPTVNIGIIGHVAHGKTTLIQALTGIDTRRHKKEIQSNRTLRLGYTNIKVTKCICDPEKVIYKTTSNKICDCETVYASIIDCPGHNVLLSTMISAAHLMDACLLVVAANEQCPQNQTREHIDIIQMIGRCNECLVAQNKVDVVTQEIVMENKNQVDLFMNEYGMNYSSIIPVSAQKNINVEYILEYIFKYVSEFNKTPKQILNTCSTGVVIRTFDITKPGDEDVKGAILGGSICTGTFSEGDNIIILPYKVITVIKSIRSENTSITHAHSGGLIAIQTDINPSYCDRLVGCTFMKCTEFNEDKLIEKGRSINVKCHLLKTSGMKSLAKNSNLVIHFLSQTIPCTVMSVSKNKYVLQVLSPLYLHCELEFIMTIGGKLIGYGHGSDVVSGVQRVADKLNIHVPNMTSYEDMYRNVNEQIANVVLGKTIIPVPKVVYQNTYTTVTNFPQLCSAMYSSLHDVGDHIYRELGCRSWSINGQNQLLLKGRTTEMKVMSVLKPFLSHKHCTNCKSLDTIIINDRGVKKNMCNVCKWSEVKSL